MTLAAGARLGPYEIQSPLGAGGMGEVYRATDTRLHRTVAIKILPAHAAADAAFRERFEREAHTISSLEHPHICPLYDVGDFDGTPFLVMQFLDGETLAQRLERGALPVEKALAVGGQILEALDAAHRAGIIHRDLKPANIFLVHRGGPSGPPDVRLLDFGLAKKTGGIAGGALSMLPTTPPELTAQGTILGTFQYMAPEQLEGDEADARTDIFAFGAVLYEMVTGRKAFEGRTQASLIAAILDREPPALGTLQPLAPPTLERIVQRCLAKNREDRWQTARDLLAELQWVRTEDRRTAFASPVRQRLSIWPASVALLATALAATGFIAWRHLLEPVSSVNLLRFQVPVPALQTAATHIAVSPDGSRLVYANLGTSGSAALWAHSLESALTTELTAIRQPNWMVWAPDSRRIAFVSSSRVLQALDLDTGALQSMFELTGTARGLAWGDAGIVVASDTPQGGALFLAAGVGAAPRMFFERPGAIVGQPQFSEDDESVIYLMTDKSQRTHVCVAEIGGEDRGCLELAALSIAYSATGHLLFSRDSTVFAQRFDPRSVALTGDPISVALDVGGTVRPYWGMSGEGSIPVLAYFSATARGESQFAWFDRSGSRLGTVGEPAPYGSLDLSNDGRFIIAQRLEPGGQGTFLIDAARGLATRASPPRQGGDVVWAPDGRRYARHRGPRVIEQPTFGGEERVVFEHPQLLGLEDWSPDGLNLLVAVGEGSGRVALAIPLAGGSPIRLATSTGLLDEMRFSPGGRWMAFNTDESGRHEVYVAPITGTGERWPVSNGGGLQPRWRGDGLELYYLTLDGTLMRVSFAEGSPPDIGTAAKLFDTGLQPTYNLDHYEPSREGTRFLIRMPIQADAQSRLEIVLNWTSLLPR